LAGVLQITAALCGAAAAGGGAPGSTGETLGKLYKCQPGPWGNLEYYYVQIEMPERLLDLVQRPDPQPRWNFPGATEASLRMLFEKAGLPEALTKFLLDPENMAVSDSIVSVFPPMPDLLALTREQRTVIYGELAKTEANVFHHNPTYITNGDPDAWFARSGLRPELLEAIKKLTYMRGEVLCFCDLGVLFAMVKSDREARDVVRAASRTSSMVLQLDMKTKNNLAQVAEYWAACRRNSEAKGAVSTAAHTEGITDLDCIHLLPPLPRRYLHNYYLDELSIFGGMPDCHWSSLNFFNLTPIDYARDPRLVKLHVEEDYEPVEAPYQFGDVLMFLSPSGEQIHSCVYVADDIVYTKNGRTVSTPWTLNKISDLRRLYSYEHSFKVQGYRIKTDAKERKN
jgi:hypothetical protein